MKSSYHGDMTTTAGALEILFEQVNEATKELQSATTVPAEVATLVDSLDIVLHADAPLTLVADPYLTTTLFAAAFRAEKALRHDNDEARRRDLRVALEQFRLALRDIVASRPFAEDTPVTEVLANVSTIVAVPQRDLADLMGVSIRQLQRWLAPGGPAPSGDDEARVRIVAQLVNQLRHTFTGPGVVKWFHRRHPTLHVRPVQWLDDPLRYPALLSAATASRAMSG